MVILESITKETWKVHKLAILAILMWMAINQVFVTLNFDLLYSTDSKAYLFASQNLDSFPPLELPGYPAMVALCGELLPTVTTKIYMQAISLVAYILAVVGVYLLLDHCGSVLALPGALLFALFPLEGVTLSVFPRVNSLMYSTLVLALFLYIKGYNWLTIITMALSLFTHKSVWPVIGFVGISGVFDKRLKWWHVILIFLPLAAYWVVGALHHSDLVWLLNTSVAVKFESRSDIDIPVFAGLMGTFKSGLNGDIADLLKAIIVTANFTLAVLLLYSRVWSGRKWLLSLILPALLWPIILNQGELWSSITYTHLIVLPLVFWLEQSGLAWVRSRKFWLAVLAMCAVSQVVWAIYEVYYFS